MSPDTMTDSHAGTGPGARPAGGAGIPATGGRVQLALNVSDVDAAVEFYAKLFNTEPAKRRPGYANFAIVDPPLKLVLIEDAGARGEGVAGALNHLGVEVPDTAQVSAATRRLTGEGLATLTQDATSCCYAVQDKVWVHDPDGAPWEVYTVLADAPSASMKGPGLTTHGVPVATSCCDTATAGSCCEPSAKATCCGDTGAGAPSSCGCS